MKHQVEAELRSPDLIERNIKLGHGGIRELEFIVQSLTLIYGGRDPRIRIEKTIEALDRLAEFGYLPAARARQLAEAYLFLRDVEHKLQIVSGLQTHTLPRDDAGMRAAGGADGMRQEATRRRRGCARRSKASRSHRNAIPRDARGGEEESHRPRISDAARAAWRCRARIARRAETATRLRSAFAHPKESFANLEILARGSPHAPASPRRFELLETSDRCCSTRSAGCPIPTWR